MTADLSSALKSIGAANMLDFVRVEKEWAKIVGDKLAKVSKPAKLSSRTLTVWVREPVWADSMMYLKADITEKVNLVLGKKVINAIRVVTKADLENTETRETPGKPDEPREVNLPASELEEIEKALKSVGDSQLRSILKRVMLKNAKAGHRRPREK